MCPRLRQPDLRAVRHPKPAFRGAWLLGTLKLVGVLIAIGGGPAQLAAQSDAAHREAAAGAGGESFEAPHRIEAAHLPNPVQVHPRVISGGLPEGDAAFAELARLGVTTVISVDGMRPDTDTARRYGLRYIHLPHGYDGVPDECGKKLAKAVHEFDGPIYIHCHHGKHRSPAAASVACVAAGLIPSSQGVAVLELAGTSPSYAGLYDSARQAKPLDTDSLKALKVDFHEAVEVSPMAQAMVDLDQTHERLKRLAAAEWQSPPDHPDLDPWHEAVLLREHFTELLRTEEVDKAPEAFKRLMQDSEQAAKTLEELLDASRHDQHQTAPQQHLNRLVSQVSANCIACHQKFRDVPMEAERRRP